MADIQLVQFDAARRALALATKIDEVKDIRDKAEALRQYLRQAGQGLEMQNQCAEIKIRAEVRAGELLAETVKPGNPQLSHDGTIGTLPDGINRKQSSRWQAMAAIPEELLEQHVAQVKSKKEELTSAGILRLANQLRKQSVGPADTPPFPEGKYRCIVIDPPWPIEKILREVRPNQAEFAYPVMALEEIESLPIPDLADTDGCHVYLWVTHKHLPNGLRLLESWGVRYQCLMTWVKNVGFTPFSWMYSTEHVLFGRIGSLELLKNGLRLDFAAPVREHSRKPEVFYKLAADASPGPRLDMFSREAHEGFELWGNEVNRFEGMIANGLATR
jgi:N6-adenosine-specific RNA methylase IME4